MGLERRVITAAELREAVDDPLVDTVTLATSSPFHFTEGISAALTGQTALLINRSVTLQAEGRERAVLDAGGSAETPRRAITIMGGGNATLRGIEITGGYTAVRWLPTGAPVWILGGGGVLVEAGGTLDAENCRMHANRVHGNSNASAFGGGLLVNGGVARLLYSTIEGNAVFTAGGLACGGGVANFGDGDLTMHGSHVAANNATCPVGGHGGGFANVNGGTAHLVECAIEGNAIVSSCLGRGANGGGVSNILGANLTMRNSSITANIVTCEVAAAHGGGLWNGGSTADLIECAVEGNAVFSILGGAFGSGVGNFNGDFDSPFPMVGANLTMRGSKITANNATSEADGAWGGGLWNENAPANLVECTIEGNAIVSTQGPTALGGGVFNDQGPANRDMNLRGANLTIRGSNITANTATAGVGRAMGGGLFQGFGATVMYSSLLSSNVVIGPNATGKQLFNGGDAVYVLPAPLGRWVPSAVQCATIECPFYREFKQDPHCPNQPCDPTVYPALELIDHLNSQSLAILPAGAQDDADLPRPCAVGAYGDSHAFEDQAVPTCSGQCVDLGDRFLTTAPEGGAASPADCICMTQTYLTSTDECEHCPSDIVNCSALGSTLTTLELTPNHWRLSEKTSDIHPCVTRWRPGMLTPCAGGKNASSYCANALLSGPLCQVCASAGLYYDRGSARCADCPFKGAAAFLISFGLVIACAALVGLVHWSSQRRCFQPNTGLRPLRGWLERVTRRASELGLVAKVKLCVAYYQVVIMMPEVYDVGMPDEYYDWMHFFDPINFDWISLGAPPACVGDFGERLTISVVVPLVVLVIIVGASALIVSCMRDGSMASMDAAKLGARRALPLTLVILFALTPAVCSRIFSTFSCRRFDDASGAYRSFLVADLAVECAGTEYDKLQIRAFGFVVLWPIGVTALFAKLLVAAHHRTEGAAVLWHATRFLHVEYCAEMPYWELVELKRKIVLTGWLLFVPQQYSLLRLLSAILLSIGHLTMLTVVDPFKSASTKACAIAIAITLVCTLNLALLIRIHDDVPDIALGRVFGFDSITPLVTFVVVFNFSVIVITALLVAREVSLLTALKLRSTGEPPTLELDAGKNFHLFLSHNWANQDIVATIKRRLQLLLPGVRIFLDVDDLESIDSLEGYVKVSAAMLVLLGTPKYMSSRNCLREVVVAKASNMPLVRVHEADVAKGGASLEVLKSACPAEHRDFLFPDDASKAVVTWHRLNDFQLASLAQIAEQMLLAGPSYRGEAELSLYIDGALAWSSLEFGAPVALYICEDDPAAAEAARELSELYTAVKLVNSATNDRWLLFLSPTSFEGEIGARLAAEVSLELHSGARPLVLYSPEECEFGDIIDATPTMLTAAGLYGPLAIEWRGGAHRAVSVRLVARALGAQPQSGGCCGVGSRWAKGASIRTHTVGVAGARRVQAGRQHGRQRGRLIEGYEEQMFELGTSSVRSEGEAARSNEGARERDGRASLSVAYETGASSVHERL